MPSWGSGIVSGRLVSELLPNGKVPELLEGNLPPLVGQSRQPVTRTDVSAVGVASGISFRGSSWKSFQF